MPARPARAAREGNQGTALTPARPAHTPNAGSSDQPLPDLTPPYGPAPPQARLHRRSRLRRKPGQPLDSNNKEDSLWMAVRISFWRGTAVQIAGDLCTP